MSARTPTRALAFFLAIMIGPGAAYPGGIKSQVKKNIRLLLSRNLAGRIAAIIELGNLGREARAAVPFLLPALDDTRAPVRENAAAALGKIGAADERSIRSLIRRFTDEDPFVSGKAIGALASIGAPAVDILEGSLADPRDDVRWCSAISLGKIAPAGASAVPYLTTALNDKNPDVRWCAAIALGRFAGQAASAVPELLDRLRDDDRDVRWGAYMALAKIDKEKINQVPDYSGIIEKIKKLTPQWMAELKVPGVSICVIKDREPAGIMSFGVTGAARPTPVDENTVFEAGSMSKPVFSYLVLKLVEQGKLDLDKPLGDYLAEPLVNADDYAKLITARMILTHTSGLPNWRKGGEEREGPLPIYFRPGTKFSYSGEGIYYLQRVVERITGEALAAYAKRDLFDKLGLASTSFIWTEELAPRIATGHDAAGAGLTRSRYTHANAAYTLYTTPGDYAKFIVRILKPGRADRYSLSGEMAREMVTRQVRMDTREVIDRPGRSLGLCAYRGLGWVIDETISGEIVYHSGSNQTGFTCYAQFNGRDGSGIVIMTNGKNGSDLWGRLVSAVGDL